jgi:aminoglycoside phosphotransferase (APT) family kinase protein
MSESKTSEEQSDVAADPAGYDVFAVEAWISKNVNALTPPLRWTRLEGGHSNLTYRLDDERGNCAVIRRPPLGELLPKAHDMQREWSIISALGQTAVPVAAALGFCPTPDVTGAHFYVMGMVEGRALYNAAQTAAWVPEQRRQPLAWSFIDVLADLHAVDPGAVGLAELGKSENYIGRQLRTWYRSWTSSAEAAGYDDPRLHELQDYLVNHIPDQGPARIVHGDYGLHNCLVGADGLITAVLDWEISTLGDPLADLAYALNQWSLPGDEMPGRDVAATALPGFPSREALAARYAERTGRDLSELDYYTSFNWCKTAMIIHGVYARYMEGKKSTVGVDLDDLRLRIERALILAGQAVERLS